MITDAIANSVNFCRFALWGLHQLGVVENALTRKEVSYLPKYFDNHMKHYILRYFRLFQQIP